ncbi:MAG: hypothetical protein HKN22_01025, partial [Bacteroidia bacterium]|nr:hypothetical protein [Bacteroidia bacterium]
MRIHKCDLLIMNVMTISFGICMKWLKSVFCLFVFLFLIGDLKATTWDTIPKGSYIINLGITPQTIENGLKPYGLVHVILEHFNTPVIWAINP